MINTILNILKKNNINDYFVTAATTESAELFFVKKNLDMRRSTDITKYSVTVIKQFEKDGKKLTGNSIASIEEGMSEEDIAKILKNAYVSSEYAGNPAFEYPAGIKAKKEAVKNKLSETPLAKSAMLMAEALYAPDKDSYAFINSSEIFVEKKNVRIVGSNGCDVEFTTFCTKGEFVVQCLKPNDVEMFHQFEYDDLDTAELTAKASEALEIIKARASVSMTTPKGNYKVILADKSLEELMSFYITRADASMIYPKYSNYEKGMNVTGDTVGDKLTIRVIAKEPFSSEGIPMIDRTLIDKGVLETIVGNVRISSYIGTEPTGTYRACDVDCGTTSYAEMTKEKYLQVVSFSDFQCDEFSGHFGGEIRLAYLFDGKKVTPVTGGSINGSILTCQKNFTFSAEKQKSSTFTGPKYVALYDVAVAGE